MKIFNSLGSLASIIGLPITLFSINWGNFSIQENWFKLSIAFVFCLVLIIVLINVIIRRIEENKGLKDLSSFNIKIANVENELTEADYGLCQIKMFTLCSKISDIFKQLKGTHIAVCVKIIAQPENIKYIKTVARDANSMSIRESFDNLPNDRVENNSDFCELFYQHNTLGKKWKDVYYLANNLPHLYGYYNSHMTQYNIDNGIIGFFTRHFQWKLPYKSTLIVAVSNTDKDELYAFLCIDSMRSYCFNDNDIDQLKNIAILIQNLVKTTIAKSQQKTTN